MMTHRRSLPIVMTLTLIAAASLGCYGAAPGPLPRVTLPDPRPSHLQVDTDVQRRTRTVQRESVTCPSGHSPGSPSCVVTTYADTEAFTTAVSQVRTPQAVLNHAQFKILTDPDWNQKVEQYDSLSSACQQANVPRWIGTGLAVAGTLALSWGYQGQSTSLVYGGLAGVGAGMTSYALGYFSFGGRSCEPARVMFHELNLSREQQMLEVLGQEAAEEMKARAESYNARMEGAAQR
jgi:hypothetical protein